ncbi:hypothetical protein [Haloarcula mannanilytica]|nr:hypothetical protein [Haloarcula mannanilytica]
MANENAHQQCPVCDRRIASVTIVGPSEAVVTPCGHRIVPHRLD